MATLFEAPISHEANELEDEWEVHEHPEALEWEMHEAAHYSHEAHEWEDEAALYSPEAHEWEMHEAAHYSPEAHEWEDEAALYSPEAHEWEMHEHPESQEWENEWEADPFFGRAFKKFGRTIGRFAKRFAPSIVGKLAGMIPGAGLIAGPLAAKLTQALVSEGELEAQQAEANLFGTNEAHPEIGAHETSHEAALTEMLAAEATEAATEAEAASVLSASLPLTISIMGGRRALRPVMPALAQANSMLVQTMRRQGPAGRQLLRTVPSIQRQAVATLRAASRQGQPMTSPLAVKAMAASAQRVLNNPRRVDVIVNRNVALRPRVAPPTARRRVPTAYGARPNPYNPRRVGGYPSRPMTYRRIAGWG